MDSTGPVRDQGDLAEMVELLLEKGVVINADVVVSVGDTELLGVELRAAIASFETAAKYGLEFPDGTDRERVLEAANAGSQELEGEGGETAGEDEDAGGRARSLRLRPGGPAESGGSGETGDTPSVADSGGAEADRRTPAGAGDVTIDPAPYDPTREDRDPDADEPGVDHPSVESDDGGDDEGADTGSEDGKGADTGSGGDEPDGPPKGDEAADQAEAGEAGAAESGTDDAGGEGE